MHFNKISLFALVCFIQYGEIKSTINDDMLAFFERLKMWMPYLDCLENVDLPVMEPFFTERMDFDLVHEIGKMKGNFQNMTIHNLSKYNVDLFNLNILSLSVKANMSLPELVMEGLYELDGNIGDLIPIYGEGDLNMSLQNITIGVVGKFTPVPFRVSDLKVDFDIGGFTAYFDGLMGDPELEETFNKLINDIAMEALHVLWPEIEVGIVEMVKKMVADADLTVGDLLQFMQTIKTLLPEEVPEECKDRHLLK